MTDLTLYPTQLAQMSIEQLAALPAAQKLELNKNLDEAIAWLKAARANFNVALDHCYGVELRAALHESGRDFGTAHTTDGMLSIKYVVKKVVIWDQVQLGAMAARIAASGDKVADYIDTDYGVSESRFNAWPGALKEQFTPARTTKPGTKSYELTLTGEKGGA